MLSQFVNGQRRSIEDVIRQIPDWSEKLTFLCNGLADRPIGIQGMRPPSSR